MDRDKIVKAIYTVMDNELTSTHKDIMDLITSKASVNTLTEILLLLLLED